MRNTWACPSAFGLSEVLPWLLFPLTQGKGWFRASLAPLGSGQGYFGYYIPFVVCWKVRSLCCRFNTPQSWAGRRAWLPAQQQARAEILIRYFIIIILESEYFTLNDIMEEEKQQSKDSEQ